MNLSKKQIVLASPFLIITINFGVAYLFGNIIGKWAFIPIILIGWYFFLFFIFNYTEKQTRKKWLQKAKGQSGWNILALVVGIFPLPLFLLHYDTLAIWQVWLTQILLALINPWLEEFYWLGLLLNYIQSWSNWAAIIFTSWVFALKHAVFGGNSELNSGFTIIISTLIMGIIWGLFIRKQIV